MNGLDRFREHFKGMEDRYVFIGGCACDIAFDAAGLEFRATKDLDIVILVESLDAKFTKAFWEFVKLGEYEVQESAFGEKRFYRFKKPRQDGFPAMLELFARAADALGAVSGTLTPIPIDEEVSSLSAILLDDDYYAWVQTGKRITDGLPVLRPEHLIPLKAKAWLDLRQRAKKGEKVDDKDIKKHKNDVFRIYQIVDRADRIEIPPAIQRDMQQFLDEVAKELPDMKSIGLKSTKPETVLELLRVMFLPTPDAAERA